MLGMELVRGQGSVMAAVQLPIQFQDSFWHSLGHICKSYIIFHIYVKVSNALGSKLTQH